MDKVVGGNRESVGAADEDDSGDATALTRAAYMKFVAKHPGRITFKEPEGMMEGLFVGVVPARPPTRRGPVPESGVASAAPQAGGQPDAVA